MFYRAIPALRLIHLAQDAVQLLLGQNVEIDQRVQRDTFAKAFSSRIGR